MDTWATASLTPRLLAGWPDDAELRRAVYPMDMRPQAHEIIRTWLFDSVLRAIQMDGSVPWHTVAISGFVTDPDRKKMGKSIGNVVTPMEPLREYGSDAVRYWAATGRPGVDATYDTNRMRVGRRLAMKILNVGRFVLGLPCSAASSPPPDDGHPANALDRAMLAALDATAADATAALDAFEYARALAAIETFFWTFCDDYLELVKARAYAGDSSAGAALMIALDRLLRMFAPFLPYVTEEVWSWWQAGSVHLARWPAAARDGDPALVHAASTLVGAVRRDKGVAMRTDVESVTIPSDTPGANLLPALLDDLRGAAHADRIILSRRP